MIRHIFCQLGAFRLQRCKESAWKLCIPVRIAASIIRAITLMMEAARSSETLVNFYQTTRRYNPKDSHLRTHRRENLKSYFSSLVFRFLNCYDLHPFTLKAEKYLSPQL
jgi:hypothetical protein